AARAVWARLLRRPVSMESSTLAESPDLSPALRAVIARDLRPETAAAIRAAARPGEATGAGVPVLLAVGARDPLLEPPPVQALAGALGAEGVEIASGGHWLSCGVGWQQAVAVVHRWAVRGLPAGALEFYEEAMAERDDDEEK